ncbi:MAG: phage holin family protein [Bacteroidota bacterium]|nr:phage holin family protein [Bacteroidota bacterium]
MIDQEKIDELSNSLKKYVNTNYELFKLEASERSSVIGSGLISNLIVFIVGLLFTIFLSVGVGLYLSYRMGDNYSGFIIVGGFYFLLYLILMIGKKSMLENPIRNMIIRKIFSK